MHISLSDSVFEFAVAVAVSNRLFTLRQVAHHPLLSSRTQPVKRASALLRPYANLFEKLPGPHGQPFRFRLSAAERRRRGITFRAIDGCSHKSQHWIALGDMWVELTLQGGRPAAWMPEPKDTGGFDVFFVWHRIAYVAELQRHPLTQREWKKKWDSRIDWYATEGWRKSPWQRPDRIVRPVPLLVDLTNQQPETVGLPKGFLYTRGIDEVPRVLNHLEQRIASN